LSVWALASDERPTEKTLVYHAPFFNVTNGNVCMGNVKVPEGVNVEDAGKWEKLFFRSVFTDEGDVRLSGIEPANLWNALTGGKHKEFPAKHLVKAGILSSVIRR
jgi:PRTRC genetic system protein B